MGLDNDSKSRSVKYILITHSIIIIIIIVIIMIIIIQSSSPTIMKAIQRPSPGAGNAAAYSRNPCRLMVTFMGTLFQNDTKLAHKPLTVMPQSHGLFRSPVARAVWGPTERATESSHMTRTDTFNYIRTQYM